MAGFDILNITGSVSKSIQKDPFSAVTERSVVSPTLANSILGIRPGEKVGNSKCREWQKSIFPPSPTSGNAPSVPRELLSSPSQSPAASTSYICPFGALSSLFIGKNNLLLYMILELISLLLIRTSSSLSLALTCLYSLYSSAMGVRSSFCTFLVEVKADHEDFCNRKPPSAPSLCPPTKPTKQLLSSLHSWSGNKTKTFLLWEKKKKQHNTKQGANKLFQEVWDACVLRLSTTPQFPMQNPAWKMPCFSEITSSVKRLENISGAIWVSACDPGKIKYSLPWLGTTAVYMNRHTRKKKDGIWSDCSWLTGKF